MNHKKVVLYLGGGGMCGIFSGGVLRGLEKLDFYKRIEAIYAESAGALNGAYFLARQSETASKIYLTGLTDNFVLPGNFFIGLFQRFWNRFIHKISPWKIRNIINIEYLFKIIRKTLESEKVKNQPIDFYVKLLNIENGDVDYLDAKKYDVFKVLKASVSVAPYYLGTEKINGKEYIDANIKTPIGLEYLLAKYSEHKIIVILNLFPRSFIFYLRNIIEGLIATMMYKSLPLLRCAMRREDSVRRGIKLAETSERVLLILPPKNNPTKPWTTDYRKLKRTFEMGQKATQKIVNFTT